MFSFLSKKVSIHGAPVPVGIAEIIICVFDDKQRMLHHFISSRADRQPEDSFLLLNDSDRVLENQVLGGALDLRQATSVSFSYGDGQQKYFNILPYEKRPEKWRFVCMQVTTERQDPDGVLPYNPYAMAEDRYCLLLADAHNQILSTSSRVPEAFGYTHATLPGLRLSDLFVPEDLGMIVSCSPDTNESIMSCVFQCFDGTKRDVEIRKYSAPDGCMLYGVFDVTRSKFNEEILQVRTRERRRIGQDLHDSIGQLLTGISLLSRSLANGLRREDSPAEGDAAQISELADDASNQIRQISRGLMPSEVVQRGLFASLNDLARMTTDSCGLDCVVAYDERVEFADGAVETHLFRIAQEAVNNAVRHANATKVDIIVCEVNGMPQLEIRDDGEWKEPRDATGGIGMKTMKYRASAICGQLHAGPSELGGTVVTCRLEVDELLETRA